MTIVLVTGPSRSGKSEWAEQLAAKLATDGRQVVYVATAQVNAADVEWSDRIAQHQQRRPADWQLQEVPVALVEAIAQAKPTDCLLIDSLGTWLANLLEQDAEQWAMTEQALLRSLSVTTATVIMVAEETGWGVVPAYELGRRFRDRLGALSRAVGQAADDVYLVTGGYALNLSTLGQPV
ncbi:MAG: bifunctional adenosylcobinamide kinase/adenosylcobinamide-phosphate guanylyltransferase [Phormidesmis sp.]